MPTDYARTDLTCKKKVLIAIPPRLLAETDAIAKAEYRTRSDLIREALRRYGENFRKTRLSVVVNTDAAE